MPKVTSRSKKPAPTSDDNVQRVGITELDRATKRVIAPFVRIVRKGQKLHEAEEAKQFSIYLQRKPSVLIRDLSTFLSDSVDLTSLLHESTEVIKNITKAAAATVYVMEVSGNVLYQSKKFGVGDRHKIRWKIDENLTVATYVASKLIHVMVDDIITDERFPDGIGYQSDSIKAVLCVPVVTPHGHCAAVLEFTKLLFDPPFNESDLKIALIVTGWMGAAIHANSERLALQRQQELNDYLLDLTKCFFGESVVMEKMISEIVKFARVTLNAERSSVFVIDQESGEDLVADLFDESAEESKEGIVKKPQKVRFTKERGIASMVARTGVTVNVKDAYEDTRFSKEIDQKTGFITRSILCMPIKGVNGILGVVQVVNKKNGYFTATDEILFRTFSIYCSLALRYTEVRKELASTTFMNNIYLKIINLQVTPCIHDYFYYKRNTLVSVPADFESFTWYIRDEDHHTMPQLCLYMFHQMMHKWSLDMEQTMNYILSVRRFYRKNPFHNFEHAFNVTHCIYLLLKKNQKRFTHIEIKGLLIAALNHDLDHGGCTNNFLDITKNDLAILYQTSIWENHHFDVAMLILGNTKMFTDLSKEDYDMLKQEIKEAILATDLQQYFINRTKLQRVLPNFDWGNTQHKTLLKSVMMTCADLSAVCKPFLVAKRITDNLYTEFYKQGDMEKDMGLCPLSIMDRDKVHLIPEDQVNFMAIVALPGYQVLKEILPNSSALYREAQFLNRTWQDIIAVRGKKCWRQDDSIVAQGYSY